jgi:hypothetical protein
VDGAIDTTAAKQRTVGGVDDRIERERRDVADTDLDARRTNFGSG